MAVPPGAAAAAAVAAPGVAAAAAALLAAAKPRLAAANGLLAAKSFKSPLWEKIVVDVKTKRLLKKKTLTESPNGLPILDMRAS